MYDLKDQTVLGKAPDTYFLTDPGVGTQNKALWFGRSVSKRYRSYNDISVAPVAFRASEPLPSKSERTACFPALGLLPPPSVSFSLATMKGLQNDTQLTPSTLHPVIQKLYRPLALLFIALALSNLYASLRTTLDQLSHQSILVPGNLLPKHGGIAWHPCPDDEERTLCAYFDVPLDYGFGAHVEGAEGKKVNLALRMLPGTSKAEDRLGNLLYVPSYPTSLSL